MVAIQVIRYGYVPIMIAGGWGSAVLLAEHGASEVWLVVLIAAAIAVSLGAERILPYEPAWNSPIDDAQRDAAHVVVNETLSLASVGIIPLLATVTPFHRWWPHHLPFGLQVLAAVLVADFGITTVHLMSHRVGWLWRLHAVHHSVQRFYGVNGLMKHPVHQTIETAAGVTPLLLIGLPYQVGMALAACVAVQLLLQHSNVDYRVGALRGVLALNAGHRFHHLKWAGIGDVNFGLFTLVWDRMYGTYVWDPHRRFTTADLGMAAKPDYPRSYVDQLVAPFTPAGGCDFVAASTLSRSATPQS